MRWAKKKSLGKPAAGAATFAMLILAVVTARTQRMGSPIPQSTEQTMTTQSRFYCNMKALSHTERIKHLMLTGKLIMVRKEIVELENGYEFQFSPSNVSVEDLAQWVVAESKCCPFFYFHITLQDTARLPYFPLPG